MSAPEDDGKTQPIIVDGKDITKPHNVWVSRCSPPPASKSAIFWRAFHIADDERNSAGKLYAACNICGHVLISHNSGTTNLRRHMKSLHEVSFNKLMEINEIEQAQDKGEKKKRGPSSRFGLLPWQKRQKRSHKAKPVDKAELGQAMYCISANRPFSDLDQTAFKNFVAVCVEVGKSGGTFVPDSNIAQTKVTEATNIVQVGLEMKLHEAKEMVASIDVWETRVNQNSASLAVRWIDDFQQHSCVLASKKFSGPVNQEKLIDEFLEVLKKWKIDDKVTFLVKNLSVTETEIRSRYNVEAIHCVDALFQQVIDAAVTPALGATETPATSKNETAPSKAGVIFKARKIVDKVKSDFASTFKSEKWGAVKSEESKTESTDPDDSPSTTLVSDIVGRWWSTLAMIDSLLDHKILLEVYLKKMDEEGEPVGQLSPADWEMLELLQTVLKPGAAAIKMLGGNYNCTSSLVPFIQYVVHSELTRTVEIHGESKVGILAKAMLKQFETKFGKTVTLMSSAPAQRGRKTKPVPGLHKAVLLAHALDPRFKQLKVMGNTEDVEELWKLLLEEMVALEPKSPISPGDNGATVKKETDSNGDVVAASILRGVARKEDAKREETKDSIFDQYAGVLVDSAPTKVGEKWKTECQNELKLYQAESTTGMRTVNGKEDPLSWWKSHRVAFPTLWTLAKTYLAIPATSAVPDLAFDMENSAVALNRYDLVEELPSDCDFLFDNSWVLEETMG